MGASSSTVAVDPSPLKFDSSMASSSSSAAAADSRPPKYDVFISFRGEDTRKGFTSHLKDALSRKQIEAYIDEVNLEKGDTISRALPEAIKESEISIIIFSENYGDSHWCLDELVHILKRREEKDQIVLPIFCNIDPSHVRNQKGTYAAAFVEHEKRFEKDKVQKWRQTLKDAAAMSGWDSRNMSESKIVEEVVERVRTELDTIMSKRSDDLEGLVGIPERIEKIKSYLDSSALRVGIWGMGGIGKTTLAIAAFDRFHNVFEGSYFAHDVRENAIKKGFNTFKKEVYSELLDDKDLDTSKPSAVNRRLSRKRILLVLDDVEDPDQFDNLVGDTNKFCAGSKIIVTSRGKLKVDVEYKVEKLYFMDACKLFYLKAFGRESCRRGFEEISDRVVEYTKGLPLALKVLGASVFYFLESIEDWEKELKKLKRIRNEKIQKVLEISYDALDAEEKGLFLDIACFFKGERRDFVEKILEDKPIRGLVNKSLITIEDGRIHMHDLIEEMGRDIVLRSTQRSRLWIAKDVSDVLKNIKGTEAEAIEGIYLPLNKEDGAVHLRPDVFEEMCELRLLKIYARGYGEVKVYIDGDLKYLPNGLRYLHWVDYPGKSLPSNFKPHNLVELHMRRSKLEQLWDGVQKLGSLKYIILCDSKLLTKIPDLSLAPKLECIDLYGCRRLIHIPPLNLNLQATVDKSAYRHQWRNVRCFFSNFVDERTPGCIIFYGCRHLSTLPKVSGNIRKLVLRRTALKELPSSIESLENLFHLDLRWCYDLKSLPKLPRSIEVLLLDHSGIEQIPSSIESLENLFHLDLSWCYDLKSLPKLPKNIEVLLLNHSGIEKIPSLSIEGLCNLPNLSLCYCRSLSSLQFNINLTALTELEITETSIQELPSTIGVLSNLKYLRVIKCRNLQSLPASIGMLYNLEYLYIRKCKNLQSLPADIGMLYKLKKLIISKCENLQSLPELPLFIEYVNAEDCTSLEMVSSLRSTLTLGRWLDKYDSEVHQRDFSFVNCTNLGEDAINNIFREFLYKVFCTATTPPEVVVSKRASGELLVCYPTREIPRWFNNQSEGSSITITLPPNWYNPKTFLGFVVSVVVKDEDNHALVEDEDDHAFVEYIDTKDEDDHALVEYKDIDDEDYHASVEYEDTEGQDVEDFASDEDSTLVECKLSLMTKEDRFNVGAFDYFAASGLGHIVMWYKYFDHSKANFEKYQEASLEFSCHDEREKRCGVRMLYLKDAVEESDDGTTANFESWRIDSDTDYATTDDDYQSCGSDDVDQSCGC